MTEGQAPYLDHWIMNEPANITSVAPRTAMFTFEAEGMDRQELRDVAVFLINEMVGDPAVDHPDHVIKRVVQFQISEPWRSPLRSPTGIQKWRCDVYVLAEIAPEPTALSQGLTTAWKQTDTELEALGDESPDVVAGVKEP